MPGGRETGRPTTLERLLAPRREQFVREHWGRTPLLVSAAERDDTFADLFSPAAVDELLTRRGLRTPFLRMANAGRTLADREFTTGGGLGAGIGDQLDEDAIRRQFAAGATIVLQGLHRTWAPITEFADTLASDLGHPVQVNAYVTPPQNQGFSAHYDVHDVFVLQIHGEKSWRVHPPVWPHPLRDQPWERHRAAVSEATAHEPILAADLVAGDVLYLPRGYLHSAVASGAVSIHLTVGVHTWTRAHLIEAALEHVRRVAAADPQLRSNLPLGVDVTDPADLAADAEVTLAALARALGEVRPDALADGLRGKARAAQRPAPVPVLAQSAVARTLSATDRLVARPHLLAELEPADGSTGAGQPADEAGARGFVVRSRAGRCAVPAQAEPAVRRLLAGDAVPVGALLPDEDDAIELGRRLLIEGVAVADGAGLR